MCHRPLALLVCSSGSRQGSCKKEKKEVKPQFTRLLLRCTALGGTRASVP